MTSIPTSCPPVNAKAQMQLVIREAETSLYQTIALRLTEILLAVVCYVLSRPYHRRRRALPIWVVPEGVCSRCKRHQSRRFSRNGFRPRRPLSRWGEIYEELPRVRRQGSGSARIDFGSVIRPYQRICDDLNEQIQRWGQLRLSSREMRTELDHLHINALGLRTLNERLHLLQTRQTKLDANDVPPVLKVDAIWATQLRPNGQFRRNRKGRLRPVKGRCKRPILIAMGVWPETGRCAILAWQLAENEEEAAWIAFLGRLEAQGIRGANGLQVVIHDGGNGLCSALRTVYFDAEQQRCLFHKLRNIWQALQAPDDLSPKQSRRHRKALFRNFRAIWKRNATTPHSAATSPLSASITRPSPRPLPPCVATSVRPSLTSTSCSASLLTPRLPAYFQSPRTLQSPPALPSPCCRLPLRPRHSGHGRSGSLCVPCLTSST